MKIFGREPAAFVVVAEALIAILVTFNLSGLSTEQAGLVVGLVVALGAAVQAWTTEATRLAGLLGVVKAALVVGVAYGVTLTNEQVGLITAGVAAVAGLFLRTQTSPVDTAVSTS